MEALENAVLDLIGGIYPAATPVRNSKYPQGQSLTLWCNRRFIWDPPKPCSSGNRRENGMEMKKGGRMSQS